ncbi:MAG: hypothetical protein ACRDD7_06385 [Peptostreptococcaceae bacterium]
MRRRDIKFKSLSEYIIFKEKYINKDNNIREAGLKYAYDGIILTILEGLTE